MDVNYILAGRLVYYVLCYCYTLVEFWWLWVTYVLFIEDAVD